MRAAPPRPVDAEPIRIGVSACLLGQSVRYDGGHKRNCFLVETLGPFVEWVPVCPEVEIGLGIPRPTLRLEAHVDGALHLVTSSTGEDRTAAMQRYARARVDALARQGLCGYVLKKDSPSCGMERVKVYGRNAMRSRRGRGVFAAELLARCSSLPVEDEGRLKDPRLRENFVERVFAYHRWRMLLGQRPWAWRHLVAFHTVNKLQVLAHSPRAYTRLGRLVATPGSDRSAIRAQYEREFMTALSTPATRPRHVNVLQHILGHFRGRLDAPTRAALRTAVADYVAGY